MVDPKPLMKLFGTGANVIAQVATDKATNARRQTAISSLAASNAASSAQSQSDYLAALQANANPVNGKLLIGVETVNGNAAISHGLGRAPVGGFVVGCFDKDARVWFNPLVPSTTTEFTITANLATTVNVWIF